jgi:hypothetical protein
MTAPFFLPKFRLRSTQIKTAPEEGAAKAFWSEFYCPTAAQGERGKVDAVGRSYY